MTILFPSVLSAAQDSQEPDAVRCRVEEILSDSYDVTTFSGGEIYTRVINFRGKILTGSHKGETILVRQELDELGQINAYPAQPGDTFFVYLALGDRGQLMGYAGDQVRDVTLLALTVLFLGGLLLFGGWKGMKTIVSLALTVALVFLWFIPSLLQGRSPKVMVLLVSSVIILLTLAIVIGLNKKALSAALGCLGGVAAAGLLCAVSMVTMRITGLVDSDAGILMYVSESGYIDLKGMVFAGIIIGALGATMDVAISIAAALHELAAQAPGISTRQLIRSGFTIGQDMMGTMSNTLILAYVGGSLNVILLMYSQGMPFVDLINREMVAAELLQSLAGSIGMLCTIPITTIAASYMVGRRGKTFQEDNWPQGVPMDFSQWIDLPVEKAE